MLGGTASSASDWNQVGTVAGHVVIENHPSLGRVACSYCTFLIKREGCKKCLISVKTDLNGDYSLRIGLGKWRIFDSDRDEGSDEDRDYLAPNQPRTFVLKSPNGTLAFDIVVRLP
jgi:hypothetical protein